MTHASLFSGIGGPEVAAAMLGWKNAFHCEINDFGRTVLEYWFPNSTSYDDIKTTDFKQWRGKIDVLTGGFPCQPFSYAGKRRGADDERYLWPHMLRAIEECRPTWVVGENVAGIVSMVEQGTIAAMESQAALFGEGDRILRYRQEQPFTIERVCRNLEGIGYTVQPMLIPACSVGAPHRRDRVFIIAHAENAVRMGLQGNEKLGNKPRHGDVRPTGYDGQIQQLSADTESDGNGKVRDKSQTQGTCRRNELFGISSGVSYEVGEHWRNFPTVSPIHRGNDGLPFDVDRLTLPFPKWRNESLKAYGNAIVPQLIYEIFRAIEIVTQNE